jgi:hypothetical protein
LLHLPPAGSWEYAWDPRQGIRLVSAAQSLGKERTLAAVLEYLRVNTSTDGTPFAGGCGWPWLERLLSLLFEVPRERLLYLDSFVIIEEIPLMPYHHVSNGGGGIPGQRSLREPELEVYRSHGSLRRLSLRPGNGPLDALVSLEQTDLWKRSEADGRRMLRVLVMNQLLRLVYPVYRPRLERDVRAGEALTRRDAEERWPQIVREFEQLQVRWDPARQSYTFRDGSTLPP